MSEDSADGAQYEPIDENGDQPVTRAEFNDAMRGVGNSFAGIESDVAQIRVDMATQDDLQELEERIAAKLATLATTEEFAALEERLVARIDAQAELTIKALTRHIDTAVDRAVKQSIEPLEERVTRLEEISGLSPAA